MAEAYGNFTKRVDSTDWHWYVVTYRDGREELTYFKVRRLLVPHGGRLCRGILFPRYWGVTQYEHTTDIRLAF